MTNIENKVLETEADVSIELTYENVVNMLQKIEKEHGRLKAKFMRAQDKHSRAKGKRSLYESAMRRVSYEMDVLSMQYCDILLVANQYWWTDLLLQDTNLQKWWEQQVEELRKFLKEENDKKFKQSAEDILSAVKGKPLD